MGPQVGQTTGDRHGFDMGKKFPIIYHLQLFKRGPAVCQNGGQNDSQMQRCKNGHGGLSAKNKDIEFKVPDAKACTVGVGM